MVNAEEVFDAIFGYGQGKIVLFAILLLVIATIFLFQQNRFESSNWKMYVAVMLIGFTLILVYYNFFRTSEPPKNFTPDAIWLGNESENTSSKNYDRLYYLQDNFVLVKRSFIDTPSRFDYSNDGSLDYLDRAGDYYKTNTIEPQWDVHIYIYNNTIIFRIILFFPSQRNVKHDLDFEYFETYYRIEEENSSTYMIPNYISFPTYAEYISHPREFITWDEMPTLDGDIKALALDPDTNSFAQNYRDFPKYNRNIIPTFSLDYDYMTQTERTAFWSGLIVGFLGVLYYFFKNPKRNYLTWYLIIIAFAIALFPLISLKFDYVSQPTFRVWIESKPNDQPFYDSVAGYEYITQYNTPWNRNSWDKPDNREVCI